MKPPTTGPKLAIWFCQLCYVSCFLLIASRALRYSIHELPGELDTWLGSLLSWQVYGVFWNFLFFPLNLLLLAILLFLLFKKPQQLFIQNPSEPPHSSDNTIYEFRPWVFCLLSFEILLYHFLLDLVPWVGLYGSSLLLWIVVVHFEQKHPNLKHLSSVRNIGILLHGAALIGSLERLYWQGLMLVWVIWVIFVSKKLIQRLSTRDAIALSILLLPLLNLASSLPAPSSPANNSLETQNTSLETRLGEGYAYTFCEYPEEQKLYAAITSCSSLGEDCQKGHILEYNTQTHQQTKRLSFLSPDFYGRLVYLLCLPDEVQVGMDSTYLNENVLRENVMSFSPSNHELISKSLYGEQTGTFPSFDQKHQAIFYVSHLSQSVFRYDQKEKVLSSNLLSSYYNLDDTKLKGGEASMVGSANTIHYGRNSIFIAEWIHGSKVLEMDLEDFRIKKTFEVNNGGAHSVAVDKKFLYVSGVWGVDIIDLETEKIVHRKRLAAPVREPVISEKYNVVFVPSTTSGNVHILERGSWKTLAVLHAGSGIRNSMLSKDQNRYYATSEKHHFFWNLEELQALKP